MAVARTIDYTRFCSGECDRQDPQQRLHDDDLGRLVQATNVTDAPGSQSFQYDGVGNMTFNSRVGNHVYPSPASPAPTPRAAWRAAMTYDPNGNLLTRARLKLDAGNAVIYPLGDDYDATPFWSRVDHLGSITVTTDATGTDNLRRSYRPYGDLLAEDSTEDVGQTLFGGRFTLTGSVGNTFGFGRFGGGRGLDLLREAGRRGRLGYGGF